MLNNYLSLSSPSPEVCGSVKALCKSVPSWAPVFISFPFPWRSSHFSLLFFFWLVSVRRDGVVFLGNPVFQREFVLVFCVCLGLDVWGVFYLIAQYTLASRSCIVL